MKKLSILLCCILLLQILCACGKTEEVMRQPVTFYYRNAEVEYNTSGGVIGYEIREAAFCMGSKELLIQEYLTGPNAESLRNPVPEDAKLVKFYTENRESYLVFSQEFAELSGIDLSVCCSCILLTLNDFANVQTIHVSAENSLLDEKKEFVLSMGNIEFTDII